MKKVLLTGITACAIMLGSCGSQSAADIKVEDLKDACGCAEAMSVIANEANAVASDFDDEDALEADADAKKKIETLFDKADNVQKHCRKELDVKRKDLESCDSYDKEAMEKLEKFF